MKKTIFALCIALSIFMCIPLSVSAAVCPSAPDGVHDFNTCVKTGTGYTINVGTHRYLYGYDHDEQPIYRDDCTVTRYFNYCKYRCEYCSTYESNIPHEHYAATSHSVNHK